MDQKLIQRAFSAYLQSDGLTVVQPTSRSSTETIGNLKYVVLRSDHLVLAVYRVRCSGLLRRMRRWPLALNNTITVGCDIQQRTANAAAIVGDRA
jgi:hypothetical protein